MEATGTLSKATGDGGGTLGPHDPTYTGGIHHSNMYWSLFFNLWIEVWDRRVGVRSKDYLGSNSSAV